MSTELSHLTRQQCLTLLAREELGRVGVHLGELPAILPVNHGLLGEDIVFRTAPGSKLSAAMMQSIVSFEVDAASPDHASGWTVLVVATPTRSETARRAPRPKSSGSSPGRRAPAAILSGLPASTFRDAPSVMWDSVDD